MTDVTPRSPQTMFVVGHAHVDAQRRAFMSNRMQARVAARAKMFQSESSQDFLNHLTGGKAASSTHDPEVEKAMNAGVPARPETLQFAQSLANNATRNAKIFQEYCFEYSKQSSNAIDSIASQINGMVKKTTAFLNMMLQYTTPAGMKKIDEEVENFLTHAKNDLMKIIQAKAEQHMKNVKHSGDDVATAGEDKKLQDEAAQVFGSNAAVAVAVAQDTGVPISGAWMKITGMLKKLQSALPSVVKNLKFARKDVSRVSSFMESLFGVFKAKGSPIFHKVSKLYKQLWVAYFVLFAILTLLVCFYGFWASGWFGGPKASGELEGYEPPRTMMERWATCWRSCTVCMKSCHDNNLSFWSVLIVCQLFVLLLFVVSIALCILAGVKAFVSSGCAQIYILGDNDICKGAISAIQQWLTTFMDHMSHAEIRTYCRDDTLLTCHLIAERMKMSAMFTGLGSIVAAVLSYQMIVEAAVMHERAMWHRLIEEKTGATKGENK
eukprot:gnl/TRDRNA2_/TRDRNA2_153490_c0_seq2.p1 gnl/TRDRNA2_/TRDRNA2_153490_c0~~gnl/TRDRNA2_/TRDRNA2_153490_c0_seq2.p1  ORF type:complete len:494 (-),score=121.64 gnl/TRDRNA2_/TRDRNA2_153490_c0_seq2:156-1637(-)